MVNALGCLVITVGYGLAAFALSPWLSRYSIVLVGVAFFTSLTTFIWIQSVFQSDDYAQTPVRQGNFSDLRLSVPFSLKIPISCLTTALALIWLLEQRVQFGFVALLVAAAMWLLVLRGWFSLGSKRDNA